MSKHHHTKRHPPKQHHENISFEKEGEKIIIPHLEERVLTAEGFRRRASLNPITRSSGICRGRKQGRKS